MRIPRDISGKELAKRLSKYGYKVARQTGSHMRLVTGEHHITIGRTIPSESVRSVRFLPTSPIILEGRKKN